MSTIDSYGDFDLPDEKIEIEVVEHPIKYVASCYDAFDVIFKKKSHQFPTSGQMPALMDAAYFACESFFADKELKFDEEQIKKVLELLDKEEYNLMHPMYLKNGLFLSALQNMCIDKLIVDNVSHFFELGHKLKKNKWLVIGKNVANTYEDVKIKDVGFVGKESKGNIINNSNNIWHLGMFGIAGLCINNATTRTMGEYSEGGIFINNKIAYVFGSDATNNGLYINNNKIRVMKDVTKTGTYINNGDPCGGTPYSRAENTIILKENKNLRGSIDLSNCKALSHLKQKLEEKLKEIDFTKQLGELPYAEQIKQAESFDWEKFKKEITAIGDEIKEEYAKLPK